MKHLNAIECDMTDSASGAIKYQVVGSKQRDEKNMNDCAMELFAVSVELWNTCKRFSKK
jgi:hypothetical protein